MAEKTLKTRMQQKHDTEENWVKATNFIPLAGEIVIYDVDENHDTVRMKIGDGESTINSLPFVSGTEAVLYTAQSLTQNQQSQARANINAAPLLNSEPLVITSQNNESGSGIYSQLKLGEDDSAQLLYGNQYIIITQNGVNISGVISPASDSQPTPKSYVDNKFNELAALIVDGNEVAY